MPAQNDATASYLGYVFQGQYALLALWDADDDDTAVSVETADDVVLDGRDPRLAQLKHSTGTPAALTITNAGFWKTVRIWAAHLRGDPAAHTGDASADRTKYLFVTVAAVASGDALGALVHGATRTEEALGALRRALVAEALRVREARATAAAAGDALPHAERAAGCEAFLALSEAEQTRLVARTEILPGSFRITDVTAEVDRRLQRGASTRAAIRSRVAERLIEWWDRQVTLALMGRRDRGIRRGELQGMLEDLIREQGPATLTNDYGALLPDAEEYAAAEGSLLARQIGLVDGGPSRVERAVRDRWRARNQRRRWTDDDASLVPLLKEYDDLLKETWGDRHGPMCDDCRGRDDDERRRRGFEVLEWAYEAAPQSVRPPRPGWGGAFYVRGMLQQFADELEVGWHPDYLERLAPSAPDPTVREDGPAPAAGTDTALAVAPAPSGVAEPGPAESGASASGAGVDLREQLPSDRALAVGRPAHIDGRRPARPRRPRAAKTE